MFGETIMNRVEMAQHHRNNEYHETINSTKSVEQRGRTGTKPFVDIKFDLTMPVTVQQEHFIVNQKKKSRLIKICLQQMEAENTDTI